MLPESRARVADDETVSPSGRCSTVSASRGWRASCGRSSRSRSALYGWFAVFSLYFQRQLGFTLAQTDYFFSIFAIFNVFMNVFMVGRISARLGDRGCRTSGLAALVGGFASLPFVHDAWAAGRHDAVLLVRDGASQHGHHRADQQRGVGSRAGHGAGHELFARLALGHSRAAGLDQLLAAYGPALCRRRIVDDGERRALDGLCNARSEPGRHPQQTTARCRSPAKPRPLRSPADNAA